MLALGTMPTKVNTKVNFTKRDIKCSIVTEVIIKDLPLTIIIIMENPSTGVGKLRLSSNFLLPHSPLRKEIINNNQHYFAVSIFKLGSKNWDYNNRRMPNVVKEFWAKATTRSRSLWSPKIPLMREKRAIKSLWPCKNTGI